MQKTLFSHETRQFTIKVCIILGIVFVAWLLYTIQSILFLFLGAIFVALLISPFVSYLGKWHLKKWRIPDTLAILLSFSSLLIFISLFILAILPIFVDLGNNTKETIKRGITSLYVQAENDFPFLNALPLDTGKIIRNEFDTNMIADIILNKEKTIVITENLTNNIDVIQSLTKRGF
jgi:predicted PurR-regulated permease PerM